MFNENRFGLDKCVEPHSEKWVLQHRPRKWDQTPQKRTQSCQKERFLGCNESLKAIFLGEKVGVCWFCSEKRGSYNTANRCDPSSLNRQRPPSARPLLPLKIKTPSILKKGLCCENSSLYRYRRPFGRFRCRPYAGGSVRRRPYRGPAPFCC